MGAPTSSALALLVAVWIAVLRRLPISLLVIGLSSSASVARAQVDAQRFRVTDGGAMPLLWEGDLGPRWTGGLTLSLNTARTLAVLEGVAEPGVLLDRVWTWELSGSMNFGGVARAGVAAPFHAITFDGDRIDGLKGGDLVVWLSIPVTKASAPTQAAWTVKINAPTGRPEWLLGDAGVVTGLLSATLPSGPFQTTVNLGAAIQQSVPLPGMVWGSHWVYGVGLRAEPAGPLWTTLELTGNAPVRFWSGRPAAYPTEVLLSGGAAATRFTSLGLGVGTGLSRGLGASTLRVVALLDVRARNERDQDGDGIADLRDLCRQQPEDEDGYRDRDGCPDIDNDGDGLLDMADACPDMAEVVNGHEDDDGCPDRIATLEVALQPVEGLSEATVRVGAARPVVVFAGETLQRRLEVDSVTVEVKAPQFHPHTAEVALASGTVRHEVQLEPFRYGDLILTVNDPRGRPVAAARAAVDGGPLDALERPWRLLSGERQIRVTAEGYFPRTVTLQIPADREVAATITLTPTSVALEGSRVELGQRLHFEIDEDTLTEDDHVVVSELARWMAAHAEVRLLRIEGHADPSGSSQHNYELSERRAHAIRDALVQAGVEPQRLQPIGSGEAVRSGDGDAADRRVSFTVLIWDDLP